MFIRFTGPFVQGIRRIHQKIINPNSISDKKNSVPRAIQNKYKIFQNEDAPEIFDAEEEKQRQFQEPETFTQTNLYLDLNLERGKTGVFDIKDLVQVLRSENAENIVVCSVLKEFKYVDYMCIVTGKSYRHMLAMAEFVHKVYKIKRNKSDILPKIEGVKSRDWMALDLGNIALHIFSQKSRPIYDLDSLWSVGAEYDRECNKPEDPLVELFERQSMLLNNLTEKKDASNT